MNYYTPEELDAMPVGTVLPDCFDGFEWES